MLLKNPKQIVSIVLTAYNGEKYISEQIESILEQTYQNWELIICEDRSKDSTLTIANRYANKYPQITVIQNKKNLGLAKNFENGLSFCKGKYIAICDVDDFWMPDKLEKEVQYLEKHQDIDLVYHDLTIVNEELFTTGKSMRKTLKGSFHSIHNVKVEDDTIYSLVKENHICAPTIMFRHELVKHIVPIPDGMFQDYWTALVAATVSKIGYIDEQLIKYRQHSSNMVGAKVRGYKFFTIEMFKKEFASIYKRESEVHLSALNRLIVLAAEFPEKRIYIQNKIFCMDSLLSVLNSKSLITFIKNICVSILVIYRAKQYYNINFLFYIAIYKVNIFKF